MAAGEILHAGAMGSCPHQTGQLSISSAGAAKVKVSGQAVVTASDTFSIAGCVFPPPPAVPQPCMKVVWPVAAMKVKMGGKAVLLKSNASSALCQSASQTPYGPPSISMVQSKVKGT